MSNNQRLAFSILEFLDTEIKSASMSAENGESLEVAVECLERVYNLSLSNPSDKSRFHLDEPLKDIFEKAPELRSSKSPTDDDKREAEKLKTEGNDLMKEGKFSDAVNSYAKAMEYDWTNAVYLCNRAAAYTKLLRHEQAVEDCEEALKLDPNYGKAYARMGTAYVSVEKFQEAKDCYAKAVELDPNNELYRTKLSEATENAAAQGNPGGANLLSSLFSNPGIMNMAQQFMVNPQMQQMMTNMMGGLGGMSPGNQPAPEASNPSGTASDASSETTTGGNAPGGTAPEGAPTGGAGGIFQFATQMAEQLQQSNPGLVNNLRETMQQMSSDSGGGGGESKKDQSTEGEK